VKSVFSGFRANVEQKYRVMNDGEYNLVIDAANAKVTFETQSMKGAKAGLAELKRRKKLVTLQKREASARLRENRSSYWGTREMARVISGNWVAKIFNSWARISAYSKTADTDFEIAHFDRVLIAIDRAILDLETQITALKN